MPVAALRVKLIERVLLVCRGFTYLSTQAFALNYISRINPFSRYTSCSRNCDHDTWKCSLHWLKTESATYVALLQKCGALKALSHGMRIHKHITACGIEQNAFLENNLLYMYVECGALADARKFFDAMRGRNQFSWNVIIRSFVRCGQGQEAFELFEQMHREGMYPPDTYIFVSILSACSAHTDMDTGMHIHACIVNAGLESHVIVATALVNMYGKHGMVEDAARQFDTMLERNMVSWNAMIAVRANSGQIQLAIELYAGMQKEGLLPDKVTFVSILHVCTVPAVLWEGKRLHAILESKGLEKDIIMDTALVDMYGKCGSLENAQGIFDGMQERNTVSWTALISAYAQHGEVKNAAHLYKRMHQEGILADKVMFVSILDACACEAGLMEGKLVHASIAGSALEVEVVVGTALVNMYGKCGNLDCARRIFDIISEPNDFSWNSMIAAYVQYGHIHEALELFGQMHWKGEMPHELTIVNVLHICASQGAEAEGKQVHSYIVTNGLESGVVEMALVNMYGKCGSLRDAHCIFNRLSECMVVAWNAIITAYVKSGGEKYALQFFEQMQQEGSMPDRATFVSILGMFPEPLASFAGKQMHSRIFCGGFELDASMGTSLINIYGKLSSLRNAWSVFDRMPIRNIVVWNAIMAVVVQNGLIMHAFQLFTQMKLEGVIADKVIILTILNACADQSLLAEGKKMHVCSMVTGCDLDVSVGTALVNMYGRCGRLDASQRVFDELPHRNLLTWTCMIAVLAQHGQGNSAIMLFDGMLQGGTTPDKVTYTSVLSACAHAGMIDDGYYQLLYMERFHGIPPVVDHFNCIIDLLGKAGQLDEAENLVKSMPIQPTATSWTILLDACRRLSDVGHGECLAKQVFEMDAEDAALFVTLSNVYLGASNDVASEI